MTETYTIEEQRRRNHNGRGTDNRFLITRTRENGAQYVWTFHATGLRNFADQIQDALDSAEEKALDRAP